MEAASSSKTFVPKKKHAVLSQKTGTGQHTYFNFPVLQGALLSFAFIPFVIRTSLCSLLFSVCVILLFFPISFLPSMLLDPLKT